ncbi:nucleotide pyrophosphohydrolase [Simkania sp.]|uniref:nucleotide pyrophosphohydrolase n=1 Tax=Simkania sp. TaxID=34094 RepID=UPI003B51F9E7
MAETTDNQLNIKEMQEYSQRFVEEREWDQYHTPKNIAMGIAIEASELMEIFQWLTENESFEVINDPKKREQISDEIGDVLHYLIRLSTLLDIDLNQAFWNKIKKTEAKYPPKLVKGKNEKYTEYES